MPKEIAIIVGETEYRKAEGVFTSAPGMRCIPSPAAEAEFAAVIRSQDARHVVIGVQPYRDALYTSLPRGGVIARFGVGHDGVDKAKASAHGLFCTNTPGVLDESVAEHTMTLILAAAHHFVPLASGMRGGEWTGRMGYEVSSKTLTIVGAGSIGKTVARMAAFGFGMKVIACIHSTPLSAEDMKRNGIAEATTDFAAAVSQADYLSLHIPATQANAHFINRDRLSSMPAHCWLINTARGAVVDENALYEVLAAGAIRGAALDVFEREPYVPADPARDLRKLDNALLTPHMGSNTVEANRRMAQHALRNIALCAAGDYKSMNLLNPEVLNK